MGKQDVFLHLPFGVHAEIACIKTRQFLIQEFFYFWISKKGSKTKPGVCFRRAFLHSQRV